MTNPTTLDKIVKFKEYLDYVHRHVLNVHKAWKLIQDKCPRTTDFYFHCDDVEWHLINDDVIHHDASKLSAEEFTQYRQYFYPAEGEVKDDSLLDSAWEHHWRNNKHHWQNWTVNHANDQYASAYVTMMVIDWVAMGFEFGDTAQDYYEKNKDKINLPQWAVDYMYRIFDQIKPEQ